MGGQKASPTGRLWTLRRHAILQSQKQITPRTKTPHICCSDQKSSTNISASCDQLLCKLKEAHNKGAVPPYSPGFLAFLFKNYQQKVKYSNSILHQSPISSSLSAVRKQSLQPFLSSFFKGLQAGSVRIWINTPKAHIGEATKVLIHA